MIIRRTLLAALAALCLASGTEVLAQGIPLVDAMLCRGTRSVKGSPKFTPLTGVALADRFETLSHTVKPPKHLCSPASYAGGAIADADTHAQSYGVGRPKGSPKFVPQTQLRIANQLGELFVDTVRAKYLLVPAARDLSSPPAAPDPTTHDVDRYKCYDIKVTKGTPAFPTGLQVSLADEFTLPKLFKVIKPKRLCVPVDKSGTLIKDARGGLACYTLAKVKGQPAHTTVHDVRTNNEVASGTFNVGKENMLCLPSVVDIGVCNGAAALCNRDYDAVSYATTHNAMSNFDEGWFGANQQHGLTQQLNEGIRGLMLDTHYYEGQVQLCHAFCDILGNEPLVSGLSKIRAFLDLHPNEVVTIIFESYVTEADTAAAFASSGAINYVHSQPIGVPWPTLQELIDSGKRLVVFTDVAGALAWHHYVWSYAWETHYSFQIPADFSCAINRGSMANSLFILNHFLTQTIGHPELAQQVNYSPLFVDRANQCQSESGRLPNFVTVDFYDIGDVFPVVDSLNGL